MLGVCGAIVAIIATIASPIYYTGQINATTMEGQTELRRSLDKLSDQVHDLTIAVGTSATVNAGLTQQLHDMDKDFNRRLENLEKDSQVKKWTKEP